MGCVHCAQSHASTNATAQPAMSWVPEFEPSVSARPPTHSARSSPFRYLSVYSSPNQYLSHYRPISCLLEFLLLPYFTLRTVWVGIFACLLRRGDCGRGLRAAGNCSPVSACSSVLRCPAADSLCVF